MSPLWLRASCLTLPLTRARSTRTDDLTVGQLHSELGRALDIGHQLGGRDQGLARHAVGEHRRATDTVGVHERDLGAELRRHQARLVSARSAADDDDAGGGR